MIVAGAAMAIVAGLWLAGALLLSFTRRLSLHQALLLVPLKLAFALREGSLRTCLPADGAIFVIAQRSWLDPAMMLAMLPDDTLHILDARIARAWWMEPFRAAGRTIAFNPSHLFMSRRLVRILKGGGRIAVYLPDEVEPDTRTFRLYRAVARIALRAQARIVPLRIGRQGEWPAMASGVRKWALPPLEVAALAPATIEELRALHGQPRQRPSLALFDRLALLRVAPQREPASLFQAVSEALRRQPGRIAIEDGNGTFDAGELLTRVRLLARRIAPATDEDETVGILSASPRACVEALLAASSAGRNVVLIDPALDADALAQVASEASLRLVICSREDAARLQLERLREAGVRTVWIEDAVSSGTVRRLWYRLLRHRPAGNQAAATDVAFRRAGDGSVALPARLLARSAARVAARMSPPAAFHSRLDPVTPLGVACGMLLPLLTGSRLVERESTDSLDQDQALLLADGQASQGAAATAGSTIMWRSSAWTDRDAAPGALAGWAIDEAGGPVTLESRLHSRSGTGGRFLPGLRVRLASVPGILDGGRLFLAAYGPSAPDSRGAEQNWFDTGMLCTLDAEGYVTPLGAAEPSARMGDLLVPLEPARLLAASLWLQGRHALVVLPEEAACERIVLATTVAAADLDTLRSEARRRGLGDPALPSAIVVVPDKLLDGGTDRAALRQYVEGALGEARAA